MAMFGRNSRLRAFAPEEEMASGGNMPPSMATPGFNPDAPSPFLMSQRGGLLEMPSADPVFSRINPELTAPMPAPRSRGMFGRGVGKVLRGVADFAMFGPAAPYVRQNMQRKQETHEADVARERALTDWYRSQSEAKDNGIRVVGDTVGRPNPEAPTGWEVMYEAPQRQGERERLLAALDDPNTPPQMKKRIERVLNITPAERDRQPTYQTDDAGNVFEIGPGGVRKIGGGLFKRPPTPPQPRAEREPTVAGVIAPVVKKWLEGQQLTPTEAQALNWYQQEGRRVPQVQPGVGTPPAAVGPVAPPATIAPPPKLDARRVPPPPGLPGGGRTGGNRNGLPPGYTPARARQEAADAIKRNPKNRAEVLRRLQAAGVSTAGL